MAKKDPIKSIREKKKTVSEIDYETVKGKKTKKNITLDLDKDMETLPNGETVVKSTTRRKVSPPNNKANEPVQQPAQIQQNPPVQQPKKKGGRPKKYNTVEEAKEAKKKQTLASNKKRYAEKKAEKVEGGKIDFKKTFNKIGKTIKRGIRKTITKPIENVISDVKDYTNVVAYGRKDYPPKVRDILRKVGNKYVKSISIKRTPVNSLLTGALSLFSLGKFGKRMARSFDELFHLFIEMTLEDDGKVLLEKNEVINMEMNPKTRPKTETKIVIQPIPHKTIDEMLEQTKISMGEDKFFGYSASNNNCQDFIVAFFKSNYIGDESDITFIKQDTQQLFNKLPYLKKFSNVITDLGAKVNEITTGAGIEEINNYSDVLNHLITHITDPKEPIDPRDYKQSFEMINAIKKEKQHLKGKGLKDNKYKVQSVVFDSDKFTIPMAKKWLKENSYIAPKVDREANTIRFRQIEPTTVEKEGFTKYRTKELGNSGIKLILAYKNKISNNDIEMSGGKIIIHHYHHYPKSDSETSTDSGDENEVEGGRIQNKIALYDRQKLTGDKPSVKPIVKEAEGGNLKGKKKFVKGSKEAKEHMARIRAMKKK